MDGKTRAEASGSGEWHVSKGRAIVEKGEAKPRASICRGSEGAQGSWGVST